jgi:hypothetical protein
MRDATSGAPICACGLVYQVPPMLRDPIDTAARAAGWRIFTGRTYGGVALDTAMCPDCSKPATAAPDVPEADSTEQDPLFMHLPRTTAARVGIVAMLAVLATLLVGAAAFGFGKPGDHDKPIGQIKVVEPCTAAQAHANQGRGALGEHGTDQYRCRETKPGCFTWVWQYDGRPSSGKSYYKPTCPACKPSPSTPASSTAHASPSSSRSASAVASPSGSPTPPPASSTPVPVAQQLPITGVPTVVIGIATTGGLLIAAGAALVLGTIRRRRT